MSRKIEISENQAKQFNKMYASLSRIKQYDSPGKLKKNSERDWGLDYEEAIEMAYENMQIEAKQGLERVKPIKLS